MRRRFQGLHESDRSAASEIPDGLFLVRVHGAHYRWHAQKPYYLVCLVVLEPETLAGRTVTGRIYCTSKALWKLTWFLRDFGYDAELLGRDEIDDKNLLGLQGVIKISHSVVNGAPLLNFDGFAPANQWEELSASQGSTIPPSPSAEARR
jgi:hypothetical protein